MNSVVLSRLFPEADENVIAQVLKLFSHLETIPQTFYAIIGEEEGKYKFLHATPSIERETGYSLREFSYHDGFALIYTITPPEYRRLVLEQEAFFMRKARQKTFDPLQPFIIDIDGAMQHQSGKIMDVRLICVILEFTVNRVPGVAINVWQVMDDLSDEKIITSRMEVELALREIQKIYCRVNKVRLLKIKKEPSDAIPLSYPFDDFDEITKREYMVLKLIANGLSTQKIADKLHISVPTAESHRRHLLQKFKAQNVAELINKATKKFWLE